MNWSVQNCPFETRKTNQDVAQILVLQERENVSWCSINWISKRRKPLQRSNYGMDRVKLIIWKRWDTFFIKILKINKELSNWQDLLLVWYIQKLCWCLNAWRWQWKIYYCTNNWEMHDSRGKIRFVNKYSINNDEKNSNLINFRVRLMKFVLSGLGITII